MCTKKTLFLVGCVKKKDPNPERMPAKKRYISTLFKDTWALLDATGIQEEDRLIVTHYSDYSYYVLEPNEEIYDYDKKKKSDWLNNEWFPHALSKLTIHFGREKWEKIIVLTSQNAWNQQTWEDFRTHFTQNDIEVSRLRLFPGKTEPRGFQWWPQRQNAAIQNNQITGCFWCNTTDLES